MQKNARNLQEFSSRDGIVTVCVEDEHSQQVFKSFIENAWVDTKDLQTQISNNENDILNETAMIETNFNSKSRNSIEQTAPFAKHGIFNPNDSTKVVNYNKRENPTTLVSSENFDDLCMHGNSSKKEMSEKSVCCGSRNLTPLGINSRCFLNKSCDLFINVEGHEEKLGISTKDLINNCKKKKGIFDHSFLSKSFKRNEISPRNEQHPTILSRSASWSEIPVELKMKGRKEIYIRDKG